jgi:hypothetical protein
VRPLFDRGTCVSDMLFSNQSPDVGVKTVKGR